MTIRRSTISVRLILGLTLAASLAVQAQQPSAQQTPPAGTTQPAQQAGTTQPARQAGTTQPARQAAVNDPRVGLKPGIDDAGVAAKNIELVAHLPKAEGFSNPKNLGDLGYAYSDFAFKDDVLFQGSFWGFNF